MVGRAMGGWEAVAALAGLGVWIHGAEPPIPPALLGAGSPIPSCLLGLRHSFPCWALPSLWDAMPGLWKGRIRMMLGKMLFMGCCRSDCVALGVGNFGALSVPPPCSAWGEPWSGGQQQVGVWVLCPVL